MNEKKLFQAMDRVDEKYIAESERFVKPTRKERRGFRFLVTAVAAAVCLCLIPVGAYAYNKLVHREGVGIYLDDTDKIEKRGLAEAQVRENEHLRITLDTVLSDGYNAMILITLEALDEFGMNYLEYYPNFILRCVDTGKSIFPEGSGSARQLQQQEGSVTFFRTIELWKLDTSCEYELIFYSMDLFSEEEWASAGSHKLDENLIPIGNSLGYNFIFELDFAKNIDSAVLKNASGEEIIMTQYELVNEAEGMIWEDIPGSLCLLKNDGSVESIDHDKILVIAHDGNPDIMIFGTFIELEEYRGVSIGGEEFLK